MVHEFRGSLDADAGAVGALLDRAALSDLVRLERRWRDTEEWEKLASSYTDDSWVRTSWFHGGTGREFAEAARQMAGKRKTYHAVAPFEIRICGVRALVESGGEIRGRATLDGVPIDMTLYCRFFSRARREARGWRLVSFDGIYEYDTMAPVDPTDTVPVISAEFHALRPCCRVWAYVLARHGYEVDQERVIGDDRPEDVQKLYAEAAQWLALGEQEEGGHVSERR